jgi:hypothetical protein
MMKTNQISTVIFKPAQWRISHLTQKYSFLLCDWLTDRRVNQLTKSMKQSPSWESHGSLARKQISSMLRNPEVHHCVHKSQPLALTLSQLKSVHAPPPTYCSLNNHFNIIFPTTPRVTTCTTLMLENCSLPTVHLCVSYDAQDKQRLFTYTALTIWCLYKKPH